MHKAVANNHADLVRFLLSKGADIAVEYQQGCNALTLAEKNRNEKIIALLSSTG